MTGVHALDAWLLMGSADRCRMLSSSELDSDPELQKLQSNITDEINASSGSVLDFREASTAALPLRLVPIKINRYGSGWRLVIPQVVAVTMRIRPTQSDVVALFLDRHIELWTIEILRTAFNHSLSQLLQEFTP
jgi:hypothetical protein